MPNDMYKVSTEDDSNPNRYKKRQDAKSLGFWGTLFFIYVPTILVVLIARAVMLYNNKQYIYLGEIDHFLMQCARDFMNYYAQLK